MNLEQFIAAAADRGWLIRITKPVRAELELAAVAAALDGRPVLFEQVLLAGDRPSPYRVLTGLAADRRHFALALGCEADRLLFRLAEAFQHPQPAPVVDAGPCQEVVEQPGDLTTLPFLKHWP
ncbi:MAG: UbiD family decarboxylase, partial [Caldilineales bacterium]|nr:UbiD family decarboxylase [Caldilineales bacterium]